MLNALSPMNNQQKISCKNCGTPMIFPVASSHRENHCPLCGERVCAKCGCADSAACNPPCFWSLPGECSACYFAVCEDDSPTDALDARVIAEPETSEPVLNDFFDPEAGDAVAVFFTIDQIESLARFYFPPHWRNETSGTLRDAIKTYLLHIARESEPPDTEQIKLIHRYFRAYVFAPVWESVAVPDDSGDAADCQWTLARLGELRRRADCVFKTVAEVDDFLRNCKTLGLDPL